MQQQYLQPAETAQKPTIKSEDLNRVVLKLAKFLWKKNLLEEFKNQHSGETQIISNIECQMEKLPQKKKPKKKKKQKEESPQPSEEICQPEEVVQVTEPKVIDRRWKVCVKNIQQFMKNQYYLHQNVYYKLKSATPTLFHQNFKLDMVNTRNNRRQELIITKNKRIFWVSTAKLQLSCADSKYFAHFPSGQKIYIQNPVYLSAIQKYWDKATFYAVIPTTLEREPCPEIIMIQFDY